ncbi:unnamed protein product [Lathyrus sativus]|nr:unnamed protein product [Lathyrus sativus]
MFASDQIQLSWQHLCLIQLCNFGMLQIQVFSLQAYSGHSSHVASLDFHPCQITIRSQKPIKRYLFEKEIQFKTASRVLYISKQRILINQNILKVITIKSHRKGSLLNRHQHNQTEKEDLQILSITKIEGPILHSWHIIRV